MGATSSAPESDVSGAAPATTAYAGAGAVNGHSITTSPFVQMPPSALKTITYHAHSHNGVREVEIHVQQSPRDVDAHSAHHSWSRALDKQTLNADFFLRPPTNAHDADAFELSRYADIAQFLLSSHSNLSLWRYKLVPARINEKTFWYHVISKLADEAQPQPPTPAVTDHSVTKAPTSRRVRARVNAPSDERTSPHAESKPKLRTPNPSPTRDGVQTKAAASADASPSSAAAVPHEHLQRSESLPAPSASHRVGDLLKENARLTADIERLQAQLNEARTALSKVQTPTETCSRCQKPLSSTSSCEYHTAHWLVDKTATEFLSLDKSLRDNLRREKQKRLDEVRSQMKWIVDSDQAKDCPGQWPCCAKLIYDSPGCKKANKHVNS